MYRNLSRISGILASTLLFVSVAHAQASIADCEKIQAADAYNQCLAKFGPAEKAQNLEPERPGDVKSTPEEAAASAGSGRGRHAAAAVHRGGGRHHRGHAVHRRSGGRKRMVISVGRRRHHR